MYTLKSLLAQAVLRAARDPRIREQARQLLRERVVPAARAAVHEVEPGIRKLRSDLAAAARESDPLTRPGEFARGARRRMFPDEER
jgi:hypothetical protein